VYEKSRQAKAPGGEVFGQDFKFINMSDVVEVRHKSKRPHLAQTNTFELWCGRGKRTHAFMTATSESAEEWMRLLRTVQEPGLAYKTEPPLEPKPHVQRKEAQESSSSLPPKPTTTVSSRTEGYGTCGVNVSGEKC